MPFDHSRRSEEYQGFEDLRPHSVKPHPQQRVRRKDPKSVKALPAQDNHLMSQYDKLSQPAAPNRMNRVMLNVAPIFPCWRVNWPSMAHMASLR
jgi:hypothetical protein